MARCKWQDVNGKFSSPVISLNRLGGIDWNVMFAGLWESLAGL